MLPLVLGRVSPWLLTAARYHRTRSSEDPEQLTFELEAYLILANQLFVISRNPAPIEQARRALKQRLDAALTAA